MADDKPFRYRPINVDDQSYIEIVKSSLQKKNILEDNEEYDKEAVATSLTPFYLNTLTGPGLAYLDTFNKNRKKKGLEPFEPEFLKKYFNYGKNLEDDEIDIGREFQKSITTGVTYSTKGVAEIFTTITDAIGDTNFTRDLDRLTEDFLEHQKPETWQGDVTRLVTQY